VALVTWCAAAPGGGAQLAPGENSQSVMMYFSALDDSGRAVTDLRADEMKLSVDGVPRKIGTFLGMGESPPLTFEMLLDVSGSMGWEPKVMGGAQKYGLPLFATILGKGDIAYVREFSVHSDLLASASGDPQVLADAVSHASKPQGGTAMLDAMLTACQGELAGSEGRSKAVLLISDGGDNQSAIKKSKVEDCLRKEDVVVYAVVGFNPSETQGGSPVQLGGPDLVHQFVRKSGGNEWLTPTERGFADSLAGVAYEIRDRYAIAFAGPAPNANGKPHKVELKTSRKGAILFAPQDMPDGEPIAP
jgi:VWFA-related protein